MWKLSCIGFYSQKYWMMHLDHGKTSCVRSWWIHSTFLRLFYFFTLRSKKMDFCPKSGDKIAPACVSEWAASIAGLYSHWGGFFHQVSGFRLKKCVQNPEKYGKGFFTKFQGFDWKKVSKIRKKSPSSDSSPEIDAALSESRAQAILSPYFKYYWSLRTSTEKSRRK